MSPPRNRSVLWLALTTVYIVWGSTYLAIRIVGLLTVLCASLLWSIGSFTAPRLQLPKEPIVTTVYEMLAGAALMYVVGGALGEFSDFRFSQVSGESVGAWVYLVVAGSVM